MESQFIFTLPNKSRSYLGHLTEDGLAAVCHYIVSQSQADRFPLFLGYVVSNMSSYEHVGRPLLELLNQLHIGYVVERIPLGLGNARTSCITNLYT